MKQQDKEHLQSRLRELKDIIKAEHAKQKDDRDDKAIADAKMRIANINEWLAQPKQRTGSNKVQPKSEFRKRFMETFKSPESEPEAVMKIDTIEELRNAWPNIKGKNIRIEGPVEVRKELIQLTKKEVKVALKGTHIKGFRAKKQ